MRLRRTQAPPSLGNVANWDDPPAKFELDGPFASGSRGTTRLPGQEPLHWFVREVNAPHAATMEMQLEGATLSFEPPVNST